MEPLTLGIIAIGGVTLLAGFGGSLLPVLPGPPLTALGNLIIQLGLALDGDASGLSWGLCLLSVLLGIIMTIADFIAPQIVASFGASGKTSGRYATLGVVLAFFVSCTGATPITAVTGGVGFIPSVIAGVLLIFVAAYFGGRVGELKELPSDEPNRLNKAHKAGLAHMVGLGVSMVSKVLYAGVGFALAIGQIIFV